MSWREKLGRVNFGKKGGAPISLIGASFRSAPFFVEAAEQSGGRRVVVHEYAQRDDPFVEDLGRRARLFRIDGYVIGDEYHASRDALVAALEEAGPGTLIHPYRGTLQVISPGYTLQETIGEGRMARFAIDFEETAAKPVSPVSLPDAAARVTESSKKAKLAIGKEFASKYGPGALYNSAADALRAATLKVNTAIAIASMPTQLTASLVRRLEGLTSSVNTLLNLPANLLGELEWIIGRLPGAVALDLYAYDAGRRPSRTSSTTASQRQELQAFDALDTVIRQLAIVQAASVAPDGTYDSHEAAVAAREAIVAGLDEQLELAGDEAYPALLQLRADLVRAVPGEGAELARLLSHTPPRTVPSLVLAHRLYGDVSLEADLVARNGVRHPGFVPAGRPLEVLSRG